jgi:type II secretion system protein H
MDSQRSGLACRCGGFTLIELMVVLAVIGIVTALILPEMQGTFQDMLLRSTGRQLVGACGLASSQAVTVNQPHQLRLDVDAGSYLVEPVSGPVEAGQNLRLHRHLPGAKGDLDQRIRIELRPLQGIPSEPAASEPALGHGPPRVAALSQTVVFYPDGTADGCEILLRDRDGFGLALRINSTTSRVRVLQLPRQ